MGTEIKTLPYISMCSSLNVENKIYARCDKKYCRAELLRDEETNYSSSHPCCDLFALLTQNIDDKIILQLKSYI